MLLFPSEILKKMEETGKTYQEIIEAEEKKEQEKYQEAQNQ